MGLALSVMIPSKMTIFFYNTVSGRTFKHTFRTAYLFLELNLASLLSVNGKNYSTESPTPTAGCRQWVNGKPTIRYLP